MYAEELAAYTMIGIIISIVGACMFAVDYIERTVD